MTENIRLIVGLGNPGKEYAKTRHNVGFVIVDALDSQVIWESNKYARAEFAQLSREKGKTILMKPQTFMNMSGESVAHAIAHKQLEPSAMIVVHDELDLPFGRLQMKFSGSAGGHNGVQSVIDHLGTDQFWRLRVGIGRPDHPDADISDYVLSPFRPEEADRLPLIIDGAVQILLDSLEGDPQRGSITV